MDRHNARPLTPSPPSSPSPPMPPLDSLSSSPPPPWSLRATSNGAAAHNSYDKRMPAAGRSVNAARFQTLGRGSQSSSTRGRPRTLSRSTMSAPDRPGVLATVHEAVLGLARWAWALAGQVLAFYTRLSALHRVFFVAAGAAGTTLGVLMLVYSHRIFSAIGPMAKGWHDLPGGWLLVWLMIFVTGFPPVIGYSTACTVAGLVYGFPWGWPIAASANVAGSLAAFLASRGVLSRFVDRLVGRDHRFVALSQVLRHDGLWVLAAVRFCPLPYSLSNGFLATIPSITPTSFALSTALASPKLLVHVFIGSRLARLAEDGDSMSAGDKALNYVSMAVFGAVGVSVGLLIYRRTMARAAEIARAEEQEEGRAPRVSGSAAGPAYDDDAPLMDPEDAAAAALMDDDDISLWATDNFGDDDAHDTAESRLQAPPGRTRSGSYHDESDDSR